MATKTSRNEPTPEPVPKLTKDKDDARERQAAEARKRREDTVAGMVMVAIGYQPARRRILCAEVGRGRYRINLWERRLAASSEFFEEDHILHSWMVWADGREITRADGDVPLAPFRK